MALLVLAIFTVGSVSAADDIATDSDAQTDDTVVDDIVIDDDATVEEDVEIEDSVDESSKVVNTRSNAWISAGSNSSVINTAIENVYNSGGGIVYFEYGTYSDISITLKENVTLYGSGAKLTGDGNHTVILIEDYCKNFTITGFEIDVNSHTKHTSGINASFVTDGTISYNRIYNGINAININKFYDNMTIEENTIYNMTNDAISLANPIINSNITTLGRTYLKHNVISDCDYGIFIGGNFKGEIYNNDIRRCTSGIEFVGKPNGQMGNINATLLYNYIYDVYYGINITNITVHYLNIDTNWIFGHTEDNLVINYLNIDFEDDDSILSVLSNSLYGKIYRSFVDMCDPYNNIVDATIDEEN